MKLRFCASITSQSSTTTTSSSSFSAGVSGNWQGWGASGSFSSSYANSRTGQNTGTQQDTFSLEVYVHAGQAPMPSGMSKILDILEESIFTGNH